MFSSDFSLLKIIINILPERISSHSLSDFNHMSTNTTRASRFLLFHFSTNMASRGKLNSTNLYVKNFGKDLDEMKLCQLFSAYGSITSCKVNHFRLKNNHLRDRFQRMIQDNPKALDMLISNEQKWQKK